MQLSVVETATVLGKSRRQIRYMIRQGRLKAVRQGRSWRIDGESLPLGDAARKVLRERLDAAKETVDAALEPLAKALDATAGPAAEEAAAEKVEERYSVRKLIASAWRSRRACWTSSASWSSQSKRT